MTTRPSRPSKRNSPSTSRLRRAAIATAVASVVAAPWLSAQAAPAAAPADNAAGWPSQPLKIVVGFPAGSSPDLTARAIAEPLAKALGQPVIVENKVGAGGNIGADVVAKATDQHTIGLMINGNMTIAKLLNPKVPYDPIKDLAPISLIGTAPLVLAAPVNVGGGANASSTDFFVAARNAGDKWSYGTPGVGTVGHLGMELLKLKSGINPVHIPFPGYAQVFNSMLGGQIEIAMLPPALAMAQVKAGKLKAIAVTSAARSSLVPDVPSMSEIGIRGFQMEIWNGVAAPASMPKAYVAKLSTAISDIVRSPVIRQQLFVQGWQVVGSSPEGLANRIKSDTAQLGGVITMRGISTE
ncbi:Bug family tripartite tricarboxylate transporter substrate binding protein [Variovorax sp. HJSM1_2]|uniref:Bug family tripartite tricarboxylate transporter substrate binding protein n=1 Tax=Variovorax sp. HJSM1_2 TaxID=3366263 RepID=UPI003BE17CD6